MSTKKLQKTTFVKVLEFCENLINVVIMVLLIATATALIYHTITLFFHLPESHDYIRWLIEILNQILLILMILEILYTVRIFFTEHSLCAQPFLIVALIASIRRILVISVEIAHNLELFKQYMIEIGTLGVLIFIFVLSIVLLQKRGIN